MHTKIKFPSKRLMLSLFICSSLVILLLNFNEASNISFTFNVFCILSGLAITFLFFVPSAIIKKRTNLDFMSFAHLKTPSAIVFISAFYSIYFVWTAEYFLLGYTDMFVKKLNSEANIYVVALILLAVCSYAAHKGVNAVTRCGIFIFAFSLIAFILIFSGNISNLDFKHYGFEFSGNYNNFIENTSYFMTTSFIAVIFACVSVYIKDFKTKHTAVTLGFIALLFIITMLFVWFALGSYGNSQEYSFFTLSKSSHLGVVNGIDCFYLSVSTLSVFLILSIILCCISKSTGKSGSLNIILLFSLIIFILYICSNQFNFVKEILTNHYYFNAFSFAAAVLVPTVYLFVFGRKSYV